ncbi:MAG: translation initiation factor IF-1 [Candidatus Bipolaricaulia bacterium]
MSSKEELLERDGTVTSVLNNMMYRVQIDDGPEILCYTTGKIRRFRIRILAGDRVTVEMSPYDLEKGRITWRHRS